MGAIKLSIGILSREASVHIETIRYYERIGLMPKPIRTKGGHRNYGHEHLQRLVFIRRARELGFSIDAIRSLLAVPAQTACADAYRLAAGHLADVRVKLAILSRLEGVLTDIVAGCMGGSALPCPLLKSLSPPLNGEGFSGVPESRTCGPSTSL